LEGGYKEVSVPKAQFSAAALVAALAIALIALAPGASAERPGQVQASDLVPTVGSDPSSLLPQDPVGQLPTTDSPGGIDLGKTIPQVLDPEPPTSPGHSSTQPASPTRSVPSTQKAPGSAPASRAIPARHSNTAAVGKAARGSGAGGSGAQLPSKQRAGAQRARQFSAVDRAQRDSMKRDVPSRPNTPSLVNRVVNRIPPQYRAAVVGLGLLSVFFAVIYLRERRRSTRMQRAALIDPVTKLPNRQAFEDRLTMEWKRSERYERDLGLLLLDLDDFKQINDSQGHAKGDEVLRRTAQSLSDRIRESDMAARFGGDEFVVLCPETDAPGMKALARSLEERLKAASIHTSVGFTQREPEDEGPEEFVDRADAAMYRRKQRRHVARGRRGGAVAAGLATATD
jgi:diguanylate cyclase (GGDEF)-like protein